MAKLTEQQIKLALSNTRGTMEIEGFEISQEEEKIMERFLRDEITFDEAIKLMTK